MSRRIPAAVRPFLVALAVLGSLSGAPAASADVCTVPVDRPTVQSAVSDPACTEIVLAAVTFAEAVDVDRTLILRGQGTGSTVLAGPLSVGGTATPLELSDLTIDTTGAGDSCAAVALQVDAGATVHPARVAVINDGGSCPLFLDGFETGDTSRWS